MRLPSPGVLLASGLALLAIVTGVLLLRRPHEHVVSPSPPATTATQPPAEGPRVVATTPFSATVQWTTEQPTRDRVSAALGSLPPTIWSAAEAPSTRHRVTIGGLALGSTYTLRVTGDEKPLQVTTPRVTNAPTAATRGTAILLDDQPFVPLLVWGQCSAAYPNLVAAGIDLFVENTCGSVQQQLDDLAGTALVASVAGQDDMENPGVVGWFYPDEADGRGLTAATLPPVPPSPAVGRISFLTLTNHFWSVASPPPGGRGIYRALVAKADVVGFDLYPLQVMCWPDRIDGVYDAQRELERLAPGKPTFQWIETETMSCPATGATAITSATVTAESWLAIAAGANGLGFFPGDWTGTVGTAVAQVTQEAKALAPALATPALPVDTGRSSLRAGARTTGGALYVIVANPTRARAAATVRVAGLADRTLTPLEGGPPLTAHDAAVRVTLGPLGSTVLVASPAY